MAITFGACVGNWSKTPLQSSLGSGSLAGVTAGDLLVVAFASDDATGTYSVSDGTNTYSLSEAVVNSGNVATRLWYAFAAGTGSLTATVTHPASATARAITFARFSGVGSFSAAGGGTAGSIGSCKYADTGDYGTDVLVLGAAGFEGPSSDTLSTGSSGSPVTSNVFPTNGKQGSDSGGAASNITVQFAYTIFSEPVSTFTGVVTNVTAARDDAGAGAIFLPAAAVARVPRSTPYPQLLAH